MPTGAKTFILEYRPGAGGRGVAKRRLTIGHYGEMTVEQPAGGPDGLGAHPVRRSDPMDDKARQRASLTVADVIGLFVAEQVAKLKAKTAENYNIALEKLRAAHGSMKAA